jgi:hypothetical protein
MPKRLIFDSSVCRRILSFVAAHDGPEIPPFDSASAALDHFYLSLGQS